jgi:hypothetical protein
VSGFPLPFGHRLSLLGHPIPAGGLGPPHGRLTGHEVRTPTGLPRSTRTSCDRGGCLLYPEDGDAHPTGPSSPASACRFSTASPCTPLHHPSSEASDNEASTEVHAIHPSGHSPRLWPPDGTGALGLLRRASNPADQEPATQSGWGRALSTSPGLRSRHQPNLQSAHPLVNVRPRVARGTSDLIRWIGAQTDV